MVKVYHNLIKRFESIHSFSNIGSFNGEWRDKANTYLLKVNNRSSGKNVWYVSNVNKKDTRTTSYVVLVSLLLTLNTDDIFSSASIVGFEQVSVCFVTSFSIETAKVWKWQRCFKTFVICGFINWKVQFHMHKCSQASIEIPNILPRSVTFALTIASWYLFVLLYIFLASSNFNQP